MSEIRVELILFSPFITNPEETEHRETHKFSSNTELLRVGKCPTNRKGGTEGRLWDEHVINMHESRKSDRSFAIGKRDMMPLGGNNTNNTLSTGYKF